METDFNEIPVIVSNTVSKKCIISINDPEDTLLQNFKEQEYSAAEALETANKLAKLVLRQKIDVQTHSLASLVEAICSDWNEDKLEVVKDEF